MEAPAPKADGPEIEEEKTPPNSAKSPLTREVLTDVIDLALWAGALLMQHNAESQRVEQTVRVLGVGLGCDWGDVLVSYNAIIVTHKSGEDFRTKIRRVAVGGVNMSLIEAISHLTHRVEEGKFDRLRVRAELERISQTPRRYNRWLTIFAAGFACAAFSQLLGGDWWVFGVTFVAAMVAIFIHQFLTQRHFNPLLVITLCALAAGSLVGLLSWLQFSWHPAVALAASVLILVPAVPFINAIEDLIKGHIAVGLARGATAILGILAIALGLLLAMQLTGVSL